MNAEGMETLYEGEAAPWEVELNLQYVGMLLGIQGRPIMIP